jgi:hypothetical protein
MGTHERWNLGGSDYLELPFRLNRRIELEAIPARERKLNQPYRLLPQARRFLSLGLNSLVRKRGGTSKHMKRGLLPQMRPVPFARKELSTLRARISVDKH